MKIAVTSHGADLDSPMDVRFGRCPYLLIVETDDLSYEAVANPFVEESGGVGTRVAGLLAERGVEAVLTEQCGPHAQQALEAAGIDRVGLCAQTAREAVEDYRAGVGENDPAAAATADPRAPDRPDGRRERSGRGRGKGRGRGRGRRRRRRCCEGPP